MSECILSGRMGPKGDTGPMGPQGIQGPQGDSAISVNSSFTPKWTNTSTGGTQTVTYTPNNGALAVRFQFVDATTSIAGPLYKGTGEVCIYTSGTDSRWMDKVYFAWTGSYCTFRGESRGISGGVAGISGRVTALFTAT